MKKVFVNRIEEMRYLNQALKNDGMEKGAQMNIDICTIVHMHIYRYRNLVKQGLNF